MDNTESKSKRIATNTAFLYVRMLFIMAVSLYTSRVVLNTLGIEDFGIYNVVSCAVSMLSVFNSSMNVSTQRFLNYEMGQNNLVQLQKIFANAVISHIFIAVISFLILETVGLWFVCNKLNVPASRYDSAIWVFHCSVAAFFVNVATSPYSSAVIANEKMGIYAYLSIIEVVLKLLIAYLLVWLAFDKLVLYGVLILLVNLIVRYGFIFYCVRTFRECKFKWNLDFSIIKKMFSFSGWMFIGCISDMFSKQGVNILINTFFGAVFNASYAVAMQVHAAVNSFVQNFMTAVRPQIIKSYSEGNLDYMYRLVFSSSKFSFYLLFILCFPILLYADLILDLWLENVPKYCSLFTRLILMDLLISSAYVPIAQVNQASGNIGRYQMSISAIFFLNFILSYVLYKIGMPVYWTFVLSIFLSVLGLFVRLFVLNKENGLPILLYLKKVILPLPFVVLFASIIPLIFYFYARQSVVSLAATFIISSVCIAVSVLLIGVDKQERSFILQKLGGCLIKIHQLRK